MFVELTEVISDNIHNTHHKVKRTINTAFIVSVTSNGEYGGSWLHMCEATGYTLKVAEDYADIKIMLKG